MREERIKVYPFSELRITDYKGVKEINEHGFVKIKGYIPFNKRDEYLQLSRQITWVRVTVFLEEGKYRLFEGILQEAKLEVRNGICDMELILKSGTSLMDINTKIRSFQSDELKYEKLLDICNREYEDILTTMIVGREQSIGQFVMQYQETDWEFVKRLASMNKSVVVPECSMKGIKYYFGFPKKQKVIFHDFAEYQTQCDIEEYWKKKAEGVDITSEDTISYIFESREIYELGDYGVIDGQRHYIWKCETHMKGNVLYHTYYMRLEAGLQTSKQQNANITGATLFGTVLNVNEEKIQMEIWADENKKQTCIRWFAYSTVYSSLDGTGWYCMPEIGDKVRLYFPTEREQDAYAVSAFHEGNATLRKNPECKFWRNKEGKEIQLAPDRILLTNNNGTYIELSDSEGIEIVSKGPVTLSASETLSISSANSSIELSAPNKVRLVQGETEMSLGGNLNMSGAQIKL